MDAGEDAASLESPPLGLLFRVGRAGGVKAKAVA